MSCESEMSDRKNNPRKIFLKAISFRFIYELMFVKSVDLSWVVVRTSRGDAVFDLWPISLLRARNSEAESQRTMNRKIFFLMQDNYCLNNKKWNLKFA